MQNMFSTNANIECCFVEDE